LLEPWSQVKNGSEHSREASGSREEGILSPLEYSRRDAYFGENVHRILHWSEVESPHILCVPCMRFKTISFYVSLLVGYLATEQFQVGDVAGEGSVLCVKG
jgi:hypothetical protein